MDNSGAGMAGELNRLSSRPQHEGLADRGADVQRYVNREPCSSERLSDFRQLVCVSQEQKGSTCNPGQEEQVQSWTLCCPRDCSRDADEIKQRTARL